MSVASEYDCNILCVVVIWSDSVGDLHLWEDPILWSPGYESAEGMNSTKVQNPRRNY